MEHESFENAEIAKHPQRALRQHQGRSRGAARPRSDLHDRRAAHDRPRRLADVGLPHARPAAVLRRHLLPARRPLRPAGVPARAAVRSPRRGRSAAHEVDAAGRATSREHLQGVGAARAGGRASSTPDAAAQRRRALAPRVRPAARRLRPARRSFRTRWTCALLLRRREALRRRRRPAHGPAHARPHGHGRHLRPARRRLPPLQHRRPLAGAALREDALRQRPARAVAYLEAYQATGDAFYREVVEETLG